MVAPGDQVISATVVANPATNEMLIIRAHIRAKKPITGASEQALAMEAGNKGKKLRRKS